MLKWFSIALLVVTSLSIQAQDNIEKESWEVKPAIHSIDSKHNVESAVIILDKRRIEFVDEKEGLSAFKTLHKIVRVNDDRGIESFNKVYLGVTDNADILDIKARTILANGKIIDLDRSTIKDMKDEDGNMYKIFALEGLEKGCEIEYYYTFKRPATFFLREVLQNSVPVLDASVSIISPKRLIFDTKSFNSPGITTILDTSSAEKRKVTLSIKNLIGAEQEKYSNYTANLVRVESKLSYNASRSTTERLFTWNELAKRLFDIYNTYSDKELKRVDEFIEKNGFNKYSLERDKIISVEQYLKKNFTTRDDIDGDDAENLEKVIKNKICSYRGIIRLYGAIFQKLGVSLQYVLAGDRSTFTVDRAFENWNNTENPILYFPNQKKFLAPTRLEMRFPWIQPDWGGTNGLFCNGTTIGNFTTAVGEVKMIPLEDYTQSSNNIEAKVTLPGDMDTLMVDIRQIYTGYSAAVYRASFNFSSEEQQRLFLKEMVKFGTNSENIVSSKFENKDYEGYPDNKPFVLQAVVKASELLEKAGSKILIKIGDVIGPQVEMYQEKPRQFPMEIPYAHVLDRTIQLVIPDGYSVKNLEELNINHTFKENNEPTMSFVSGFTKEGNNVNIHVREEYRNLYYPVSQYEDFKKIINAAADFNKIVLVLEKK